MLVPVIRIKEKYGNEEYSHIVGTNSHDELIIENNAIHYLNIQGMTGTQYPDESGMYFEGKEATEYCPFMTVEMVTVEEFIKIAEKNMKEQTEESIKMHEALKDYLEEKKKCREMREKDEKENGISDTVGRLF